MLNSTEILSNQWSLAQNVTMLYHWCQQQAPTASTLGDVAFVDSKVVGKEFLDPLRRLVAAEQVTTQRGLRLGGVGVDVEMDEVCFRVQRVKVSRVETRYKVRRYLSVAERDKAVENLLRAQSLAMFSFGSVAVFS